ncbi:presenilin [Thraustotheca clavata]|uniref:Presenilin n=1 Tax=Thraustotheca clavata TaxID=74557 RepID=A0A1W0A854_9STRA|nr:presenilin [Thraustotheca clavata]
MAPPQRRPIEEDTEIDVDDLLHSLGSFRAVLLPVTLTMLLSSLASVVLTDPETADQIARAYLVYLPEEGESEGSLIEHAFVNAFAIVGVFIVATFTIVICYKFKFTNFLVGYMFFSSAILLGVLGGHLAIVLLQQLHVAVDIISYTGIMYNFAIVGVLSIFYQKGLPMSVTQSYLVAVSIIMAWQLSKFPEWTTWALVIVLAFYDLCAVLTPCGPLKCLVNLIQSEGRPLPGLLYEAEVQTNFHSGPNYYQHGGPLPQQASDVCTFTRRRSKPSDDEDEAGDQREPLLVQTTARHSVRDRLHEFYSVYNPSALNRIDTIVEMYEGREKDLWRDLELKYCPPEEEDDNTIKLGLGDFVFYSVLVSRAALYDVSAMWACTVAILMGLGGTLFLLGIHKKALPALPISILFGVAIYFWMRFVLIDFMNTTLSLGIEM